MAYPPSTVATNKTSATRVDVDDDHATHHNAVAAAVNDVVAELGTGPKGGSADLTARLSALDTTVAGKQPLDSDLTTIAANITAAGHALLDDADAAAQRSTLGLGSIATQAASAVSISGGSVVGITDLAVADGGTGASTADDARTNLGLVIGTNVQAYDADLSAIAGLTSAADKVPFFTGAGSAAVADFTAAGRALVDDADAAAQRTTLGLGSMATQAASAVSITGGSVTGITDLAVADGGTGASTAADARTNLGLVIGTNVQAYSAQAAFRTDKLSVFAATTSSELAGVISDETGSGALVFGTSPTFTTDLTAPTIYGGTGSGGDLNLWATSHATLGVIQLNGPVRLRGTGGITHTVDPGVGVHMPGPFTMSYANWSLNAMVRFNPTVTFTETANGLGMVSLFGSGATFVNSSGVAKNMGPAYTLVDTATYKADAAAVTMPHVNHVRLLPTMTATGSTGALTATTLTQVLCGVTLSTVAGGATPPTTTLTTRRAMHVNDATVTAGGGAVTLTTQVGIDIDAMTAGVTNIGIRNNSVLRQVGKASFGADTAPTYGIHMLATGGDTGAIHLAEQTATPTNPASSTGIVVYHRADKLIFAFNDAGTVRYKYLDMTGTGVTWVHTTTAPT